MKITVSLDSQAVIVQPSPLRIKAGAFVPVAIAFTRASQNVSLPQGAVIEFALKPRNQWTGGLLAYLNSFEVTDGNIYTGTLNCSSNSLLGALGLNDSTPLNDLPQLEASAEVTWSFGGQKFRSSTFPVIIETPLTDDNPIPSPDPELYPAPGDIALKSDIPSLPPLGTAAALNAGAPNGVATLGEDGKVPSEQLPAMPQGTSIKVVPVADVSARFALTPTQVNVGDAVEELDTRAIYEVLDTALLGQETGYVQIGTRPAPPVQITLLTNLLAYWKLDEASGVRVDATGHGNDLSDTNGVGSVAGKIGNAASFDGANSLSCPPLFDNSQSYTIACWAKVNSLEGFQDVVYAGMELCPFHVDLGGPMFNPNDGSTLISIPGFVADTGVHFLCARYDAASNTAMLFADGQSASALTIPNASLTNFIVGYGLNGWVDELGLWNRALSDDEIASLYNGGAGTSYPF